MDLAGKKALVLGLGISGRAALALLRKKGAEPYGADDRWEEASKHPDCQGLARYEPGQQVDFAVLSPGVPVDHPLLDELPVIGEMELALRCLPQQKIVGVTGTNGKTTTTLLIAHALNQAGMPAQALGNVGTALSLYALDPKPEEILVLELSSYQLESLGTPCFDSAVILNLTPDHLDRYRTMERYAEAKGRLLSLMKPGKQAWIHEGYRHFFPGKSSNSFGFSPQSRLRSDGHQVFVDETVVFKWPDSYTCSQGPDVENALAAFAICRDLGMHTKDFVPALTSFRKPPHRCEFVQEIKGVSYYNDSKGTNVDAVIAAVEALPGPIVLVAGGKDKGASYAPWLKAFGSKVKAIMAIGEAAPKIAQEMQARFPVEQLASLKDALKRASEWATAKDQVLLSPGCSSFDMFRNYEERGEMFKELVHALAREKSA